MAMILPERTVDAWTATYITGRRWRARLWAPTERRSGERYDLGVGLGRVGGFPAPSHPERWPDKVFVFEHKGVDEKGGTKKKPGTPIIRIRGMQLLEHLYADRLRGGGLVYYLLPNPEWNRGRSAPYGTLPDVAVRRTRGPTLAPARRPAWDGFQLWAMVAHVEAVARLVYSLYMTERSRFTTLPARGRRPCDWECELRMSDLGRIRDGLSLRDFISAVRDCKRGRLVSEPGVLGPVATTGPSVGQLGPSLDDFGAALRRALSGDLVDDAIAGERDDEGPPSDENSLDAFDRREFVTFYAVGDSDSDHDIG
jgi:hypothetical protein